MYLKHTNPQNSGNFFMYFAKVNWLRGEKISWRKIKMSLLSSGSLHEIYTVWVLGIAKMVYDGNTFGKLEQIHCQNTTAQFILNSKII